MSSRSAGAGVDGISFGVDGVGVSAFAGFFFFFLFLDFLAGVIDNTDSLLTEVAFSVGANVSSSSDSWASFNCH